MRTASFGPITKERPQKGPKSQKERPIVRTAGSSSGQIQTPTAEPESLQVEIRSNNECQKKGTIVVAKFVDATTLILGFDSRIDKVNDENWIGSEFKLRRVGPGIYSTMAGCVGKIKDLWEDLDKSPPSNYTHAKAHALEFFKESEKKQETYTYETLIIGSRDSKLVFYHLKYDGELKMMDSGLKIEVEEREYTQGELAIGSGLPYASEVLNGYRNKTRPKSETKSIVHKCLFWSAINLGCTGGDLHIARIRPDDIKVKVYCFRQSFNILATGMLRPDYMESTLFLVLTKTCDRNEVQKEIECQVNRWPRISHVLCNLQGRYQLRMVTFLDPATRRKFWNDTPCMVSTDLSFVQFRMVEFKSFNVIDSSVIVAEFTNEFVAYLALEKEPKIDEDEPPPRFPIPVSEGLQKL